MKVGVCGRSGAGKSLLIQALFRLTDPVPNGCILIDGLSTTEMGLNDLRRPIAIIPQEPICFKGSVRFNLDPFSLVSDTRLWEVLELVKLKDIISRMPQKLDAQLGGKNDTWSMGQKQLLCLARAVLKRSKVIVMDEATSALDIITDELFQEVVRNGAFAESTVITIAHRLHTIVDYDFILVLDDGNLVEMVYLINVREHHFNCFKRSPRHTTLGLSEWFPNYPQSSKVNCTKLLRKFAADRENLVIYRS
jgi:ABC-type multidrug transport system fused ATPase/permease subunit